MNVVVERWLGCRKVGGIGVYVLSVSRTTYDIARQARDTTSYGTLEDEIVNKALSLLTGGAAPVAIDDETTDSARTTHRVETLRHEWEREREREQEWERELQALAQLIQREMEMTPTEADEEVALLVEQAKIVGLSPPEMYEERKRMWQELDREAARIREEER
eukprot:SAG31_NODE_11769_length_999_cov_2.651111_1_plen_163_part_00